MQYADIIFSGRVDVYADFKDIPFVPHMLRPDSDAVLTAVKDHFQRSVSLAEKSEFDKGLLYEKNMLEKADSSGEEIRFFLTRSNNVHAVLNESEHLRIITICRPDWLKQGLATSLGLRDVIGQGRPFCIDPQIGYLTSSPGVAGVACHTGIELHLPLLKRQGRLKSLQEKLAVERMVLDPVWTGEEMAASDLFYLHNRATVGIDPFITATRIREMADRLASLEADARIKAAEDLSVRNEVYRSGALIRAAEFMEQDEYVRLWSALMLGSTMKLISLQPAHVQSMLRRGLDHHLIAASACPKKDIARVRCLWLKKEIAEQGEKA